MHREVSSQPNKKTKKNGGKGSFCSIEEFESIRLRIPAYRAADIQVEFSEGHIILRTAAQRAHLKRFLTPRQKSLERKGPSQGVIQHFEPYERSPYALKFEDRSEEETLKQERCVPQGCVRNG